MSRPAAPDKLHQECTALVVGKKVRILSNYNGQVIGTSRPSLKGRVFNVTGFCMSDTTMFLFTSAGNISIRLDEVEFIEGKKI